jgi:hypothetical protein
MLRVHVDLLVRCSVGKEPHVGGETLFPEIVVIILDALSAGSSQKVYSIRRDRGGSA